AMASGAGMPSRTRGMTLPTLILVLAGIGIIGLGGFRLIPVYLAHVRVVGALSSVKDEYEGQTPTKRELRASLAKRFDIELIKVLSYRDIEIERKGANYNLKAAYSNEVPFIGNVNFLVRFDHTVAIAYGT
ncbi:MAG: DUF4845 domain-containing protein, partial [Pseudomonadota bacterium]